MSLSVVIPAKNEAQNLQLLLPKIKTAVPQAEIIVVDDGSTDDTTSVCEANGVCVVSHPYSMGNGSAIKSGARRATGETIVFMDGDGQHDPGDIGHLLSRLDEGFDMVVGARQASSHASLPRRFANGLYNWLASKIVGHKVRDLTSGFRAVRAGKFKEFLHLLPNGFSYPTTITMAFFRVGYSLSYVSIHAGARSGKSHISPLRDGAKFLLIIFKVGTLYSPLKIFVPISLVFFITGMAYYGYTFWSFSRLTNMTVLLLSTSVLIFLIGLVSEQISALLFSNRPK